MHGGAISVSELRVRPVFVATLFQGAVTGCGPPAPCLRSDTELNSSSRYWRIEYVEWLATSRAGLPEASTCTAMSFRKAVTFSEKA